VLRPIKKILLGVVLVILAIGFDRRLGGHMPPEWNKRCSIACVIAAVILLVNGLLIHWRY